MKRMLGVLAACLVLLAALLLGRALTLRSHQLHAAEVPRLELDEAALAERLAQAIRFETVSFQDPALLPTERFEAFHAWLARTYPHLHQRATRERIAGLSLLYTWQGRDPALAPLLLMAHQDVVPAVAAESWTHPPFSGAIADGFVWGRGAMDDKGPLIAIFEALEQLAAQGYTPERTLLLASGHDEEVGGTGATRIAETLAQRGLRPALVVDEGLAVVDALLPGMDAPVAVIGVAEKGYLTLELRVEAEGGHSSTPPRETAVGTLAVAVAALARSPLPGGVGGVTARFFEFVAPEAPLPLRLVLANVWLMRPLLDRRLSENPAVNATLRTTTAPTMIAGGEKENVLPTEAHALVNFRILPGDSIESVRRHAERVIGDARVQLRVVGTPREPSAVAPDSGPAFGVLQRTVAEVMPDAVVAPGLVLGGTDSRHFSELSEAIYRFVPFRYGATDLRRPHGIDERVGMANLADAVRWFRRLVENAAGPGALEGVPR